MQICVSDGDEIINLLITDKIQRIQTAVKLVDINARRAALEADGDRSRAYQILNYWAKCDFVLEDALNWVGLLISLKEELEGQGEFQRAASIGNLLSASTEGLQLPQEPST